MDTTDEMLEYEFYQLGNVVVDDLLESNQKAIDPFFQ